MENTLAKKLGLVLSVFVFLLPIFFMPVSGVSLYVAKVTLLATGLVAIFAIFLSSVLSTGAIEIPKVKYLLVMLLFVVVAFVSSAFSGAINLSIVGSVFDLGTSGSILMLVFAMFMALFAVKGVGMVNKVISAFIYSVAVLAVYILFGIFAGTSLPASVASKLPIFLVGGGIDTAIIFGAAVILSLCAINMAEISKKMKVIMFLVMTFSMVFIGAINFMPVTIILGIISLVFFVYILSWSVGRPKNAESAQIQSDGQITDMVEKRPENLTQSTDRKVSLSSLAILVASVVLILGGSNIGGYLSRVMKVNTVDVRPNFETTMNLAVNAWKQNAALGVGPNRFAEFWSIHKPIDLNLTQFWNTDFYSGSGFIPTLAITTGVLGFLVILVFIGMYLLSGIKAIFAQANSGKSRYLATASFLVSLYLWIMLFLYPPNLTVLALTFIFTGLFTATLVPQGIVGQWRINIFSNPKTNFLSVLSIVLLLVVSVAGGYFVWERSIAAAVFGSAAAKFQLNGDVALAKESIGRAINMVSSDNYWRGLTEASLIDLGRALNNITDPNRITDATRTEIQGLVANSIESAKRAIEINGASFQNWFALGRVYEVLAGNGIPGSIENARNAYNEASLRSPNNPSVPLALARLDALEGKVGEARTKIGKAIELKNNYTDAYFTLAQLEVGANNIPGAIQSVEAATMIDPNNSGLYFQLGLLKYNQRDYAGAASALQRAVQIVPDYANAKYFLGLSLYLLGNKEEAIKLFEEIDATNPNNQEVLSVLDKMRSGKSLFAEAKTVKNQLPVEE